MNNNENNNLTSLNTNSNPLQNSGNELSNETLIVDVNSTENSNIVNNKSSIQTDLSSNIKPTDDKKSKKKKTIFKYKVKDIYGKIINGTFDAYSIDQVKVYLSSEKYEIIEIKKSTDININIGGGKIKIGELSFILTQISTYLKAGISLIDSVRILVKQTTNKSTKKIYENIVYELLTGQNFSKSLEVQGNIFPKLLINMVKTAEMTGDLPTTLDDMAEYYASIDKTRKQFKSAMAYPVIVIIFAVVVLSFVLMWVVPKFESLFEGMDAELPSITKFLISFSDFLNNNLLYVLGGLIVVLMIYMLLFRKVKSFKKAMQTFYMKIPVFGNIIIYNEVTTFTKTFASLLNHGVFITDSMEVLAKVSENEVYKSIISNCINNLNKGEIISKAFYDQWAFPIVAYEMIVTGENTGRLGLMMEKVSEYYHGQHENLINSVKSLLEPILIVFLALIVGVIVLSVILPMFQMYDNILG